MVVFVTASGETHALAPDASVLLGAMIECCGINRTAAQWLALVTDEADGLSSAPFTSSETQACEHLLIGLCRLGIVTQAQT